MCVCEREREREREREFLITDGVQTEVFGNHFKYKTVIATSRPSVTFAETISSTFYYVFVCVRASGCVCMKESLRITDSMQTEFFGN